LLHDLLTRVSQISTILRTYTMVTT